MGAEFTRKIRMHALIVVKIGQGNLMSESRCSGI
jgi:hypothetical protein